MTLLHAVVPDGIDDPARASGGNAYDRRLCAELSATGWGVREIAVPGSWPRPDDASLARLAGAVRAIPDDGLVLVDGLIASAGEAVLVPEAARLRLVVLVHMPLGGVEVTAEAETAVLAGARAVVTTSAWTRERLIDRCGLPADRVHVAPPGADLPDETATGSADGGRFLCVAAVVPHKGQDVLVEALGRLAGHRWTCTLVGALDRDPGYVGDLLRRTVDTGLADRIRLTGPRSGEDLARRYRAADLLVLPTRREAYGMVVTEALAAGLPVVATAVGGVPEALGRTADGAPGLLVPPDDADALAGALRAWLEDAGLRSRLRRAARERRGTLDGWDATAARVAGVLHRVDAEPAVVRTAS